MKSSAPVACADTTTIREMPAAQSSSRRSRISLACCRQYGHPIRRTAKTRHGPVAQSCDADTIFASGHVLSATRPRAAWSIESAAAVAIVVKPRLRRANFVDSDAVPRRAALTGLWRALTLR